jgi:ribulose kinase
MEQARRLGQRIAPRLEAAEDEMLRQREKFLVSRTGKRQVETLVEQQRQDEHQLAMRRAQQMLDDWFGRRMPKAASRAESNFVDQTTPDGPVLRTPRS